MVHLEDSFCLALRCSEDSLMGLPEREKRKEQGFVSLGRSISVSLTKHPFRLYYPECARSLILMAQLYLLPCCKAES